MNVFLKRNDLNAQLQTPLGKDYFVPGSKILWVTQVRHEQSRASHMYFPSVLGWLAMSDTWAVECHQSF